MKNSTITLRTKEDASAVRIEKVVARNPRRKGTIGHHSFSLIRNGMTYEQYIKRGGRNRDLHWDLERGYIKLVAPRRKKK